MSNVFTFSFQEHNAPSIKQYEELNNTANSNEYLLTVNFNDDDKDNNYTNSIDTSNGDSEIINAFVDQLFKECNCSVKGEPCDVYSDLIKGSGVVEKRYEDIMNFKCRALQREVEEKTAVIEEMKKEIERYKKENQDVMEENKKLFEVIDMLQQIKEKELKHSMTNCSNNNTNNNECQLNYMQQPLCSNNNENENETSLRSSNDSIPILIENKRIPLNNNNVDKETIKSKTITAERQHSISSKTKHPFNKALPNKNSKSSAVSPSNCSPGHLELNFVPSELNRSKHSTKASTSKHPNSKEHINSKRNTLTNVYSNSYLFNGTKCYITINQPSTKNFTHKRIAKPPIPAMPVYVSNKHCGNKLNMKIMNSSRKVHHVQSKCLYKDEEKTNSLDDIERRLSMYVSDAPASGCVVNNILRKSNKMNCPYDNNDMSDRMGMSHQMNNKGILKYWDKGWCVSFKRNCLQPFPLNFFKEPKDPINAKILIFHGRPTPQQAYNGFMGKGGLRYVKPTKWLDKYWERN